MTITTVTRTSLGSGATKFIDGVAFDGIGSAGFREGIDLLYLSDDADDVIIAGDGNDEIEAGGGNDTLKEGLGNGILTGGDGNDDLDGGPGTEKLFGGAGDDILRAGGSVPVDFVKGKGDFDRLNGGAGKDTFGFYGLGNFEIADFSLTEDRLFFDSAVLGVQDVPTLLSYITKITDNGPIGTSSSFTAEFLGGAAYIEVIGVGVTPASITPDMIVFNL
ncbi:hemolysin expression modulating protein [Nitrosomonas sp. JL21]|uniref:hemolysin expression modulating protein n=1 Tax=Nitrosomonas sp. JL21 TaxID=153949 RepID=UPI0013721D50|nr:hemolysin expression modulating protein [Nitrosomonas sp. JL21]MBL8497488.1 hemolysin expression modulating protein [Nitrosomonas sp.]MCC7090935.1 hemolysin expression modulating protein [Nitrosomonas sp.]MXS78922.1 hemolysin expression modulating protein [Nitrosomonas sp. JL21]